MKRRTLLQFLGLAPLAGIAKASDPDILFPVPGTYHLLPLTKDERDFILSLREEAKAGRLHISGAAQFEGNSMIWARAFAHSPAGLINCPYI